MAASRETPGDAGSRRRRRLRRAGAIVVLAVAALALGHGALIDLFGGHSARRALEEEHTLPAPARAFLERCLVGVEGGLLDVHTHLAGQGNGSGCWVNPRMRSLLHPVDWVRYRTYLSAAGVAADMPDQAFVDELHALARARPRPALHVLLAFDYRYGEDGLRDLERSEFHVPNDYAWDVAAAHPGLFTAGVSIHPYRRDALPELERWAERGVRLVKWLPNAQGMDPASERCDAFYAALAEHRMVLLVHTGDEQAVEADADQRLGNPLRLRRALAAGVTVVAAHCASSGEGEDLDDPSAPPVSNFELFLRLMDEPHAGRLYGEISTITQINRYRTALEVLLERRDLHPRLVNGSDWPLPAIHVLYQTRALVRDGFLTSEERAHLNELYHHNPLSFDFALKRTVHAPESGARFAPEVFARRGELGL